MKLHFSLLLLVCSIYCSFTSAITIQKTPKLQLEGIVVFHAAKSVQSDGISWRVTKNYIDESTNELSAVENTITATGDSIRVALQKEKNKYTFYKIYASEGPSVDSTEVQVFTPGVVQKYLYSNPLLSNYEIPVWIVLPKSFSSSSKCIVTMCGKNRNAYKMASYWSPFSNENDYVVAAPEFNADDWSTAAYSLGNIFTGSTGKGDLNPKEKWTFNIVQQIQRELSNACGLADSMYQIFGFSGGAQFVHRSALLLPDSRVSRYFVANPGWYTFPDVTTPFPWGVRHTSLHVTNADITGYTNGRLVILCGTSDTIRDDELNTGGNYDAQGSNRYERARNFFAFVKRINPDSQWKFVDVPGVAHEAWKMAVACGQYILDNPLP